jgi:hypothetical protein
MPRLRMARDTSPCLQQASSAQVPGLHLRTVGNMQCVRGRQPLCVSWQRTESCTPHAGHSRRPHLGSRARKRRKAGWGRSVRAPRSPPPPHSLSSRVPAGQRDRGEAAAGRNWQHPSAGRATAAWAALPPRYQDHGKLACVTTKAAPPHPPPTPPPPPPHTHQPHSQQAAAHPAAPAAG